MFPKGFKFGFSECGFQFEMGISEPDPNSDWYAWSHDPRNVTAHYVSGDLPDNGVGYWDLYKTDHDLANSIGMNSGRLGIEWSRIFPESTEGVKADTEMDGQHVLAVDVSEKNLEQMDKMANQAAVAHYRKMFEDFKARDNFLVLNLYHWTIPRWLNDPLKAEDTPNGRSTGGCFNSRITTEFAKYAAYIGWKFGDLADRWSTMNEPNMVFLGCSVDKSAAGLAARKINFIEGHARAYDSLKKISGKPVGIIYANGDVQPLTDADTEAANKMVYDGRHSFFDAITNGDVSWYNSFESDSRIEKTDDTRKDLRKKVDWIGVNYYSRDVVSATENGWKIVEGYGHASGSREKSLDGRSISDTGWEVYPEGIYNVIMLYQKRYNTPMMITENGMADAVDRIRPRYLVSHLNQVERAIRDGARMEGYFHWALTDNYEWASGFSMKFGLFGVDLQTKKRQLRPSALVFKEIAENNGIPDNLEWIINTKI